MIVSATHRPRLRSYLALLVLIPALVLAGHAQAAAKKLKIGVTLHPYYSFVANIVGDRAEVVALIPG